MPQTVDGRVQSSIDTPFITTPPPPTTTVVPSTAGVERAFSELEKRRKIKQGQKTRRGKSASNKHRHHRSRQSSKRDGKRRRKTRRKQ